MGSRSYDLFDQCDQIAERPATNALISRRIDSTLLN